jgi:hypothetical protein
MLLAFYWQCQLPRERPTIRRLASTLDGWFYDAYTWRHHIYYWLHSYQFWQAGFNAFLSAIPLSFLLLCFLASLPFLPSPDTALWHVAPAPLPATNLAAASAPYSSISFLQPSMPMLQPTHQFTALPAAIMHAHLDDFAQSIAPVDDDGSAPFPIIVDSGASLCCTPSHADFINFTATSGQCLTGIASGLDIAGSGLISWTVTDDSGSAREIQVKGAYVPGMSMHLLSPQQLLWQSSHTDHDESVTLKRDGVYLHLFNLSCRIDYCPQSSLPLLYATAPHAAANMLANFKAMLSTISAPSATNLTHAQRKLLRWHYRLGHLNFNEVKRLSSVGELPDKIGDVDNPVCPACQYGKGHRRSVADNGHITAGDLVPGDCVSVDQFVSPTAPGRLFTSAGKEPISRKYNCATIFVDHASKFTHVEFQTTASAEVTVQAKETFERIAATHNVRVRHYHCDNGIFTSDEWKEHADQQHERPILQFSWSTSPKWSS